MDRWTIETEIGITRTGKMLVAVVLCERTKDGARIVRTWHEER